MSFQAYLFIWGHKASHCWWLHPILILLLLQYLLWIMNDFFFLSLWAFKCFPWIYANKKKTSNTCIAVNLKSLSLKLFPDCQYCLISELCHFLQPVSLLGTELWRICRLQWPQRQQLDNPQQQSQMVDLLFSQHTSASHTNHSLRCPYPDACETAQRTCQYPSDKIKIPTWTNLKVRTDKVEELIAGHGF